MGTHPRIIAARARHGRGGPTPGAPDERRRAETFGLLCASAVVCLGLFLVSTAKSAGTPQGDVLSFVEIAERLERKQVVNLNTAGSPDEIAPLLTNLTSDADRRFAAGKIFEYVQRQRPLQTVDSLSAIKVPEKEIEANPQLTSLRARLERARDEQETQATAGAGGAASQPAPISLTLLPQLGRLKPAFVVRTPAEFRKSLLFWSALYLAVFYAVHLLWVARGFRGDTLLLPVLHALSGLGLIMMASLSDPLRESLRFPNTASGVLMGGAVLAALSLFDYERSELRKLSFVPLALSFLLSALLIWLGTGPARSNAKVNLWGFQPVEVITRLLVLFLASYFAQNWEFLRVLREERARVPKMLGRFDIPRLFYVLPVVVGMILALGFFILQQDLGPALIMFCTFLVLYGVARHRAGMVVSGLAALIFSFYVSFKIGRPSTIGPRILMWLSPWDNAVAGGDQLAHSLWALATGGPFGTGLGMGQAGEPGVLPTSHTDLILPAVGEELGLVGLLTVFALYAVILHRSFHIALRAPGRYTFFLTLGLATNTALQIILITAGAFGLIPLSGVVSPLLSFGRTALVMNFAAFGIILAVSAHASAPEPNLVFRKPVKVFAAVAAVLALVILGKAAYVQMLAADELVVKRPRVLLAGRRADGSPNQDYLVNPRILKIMRLIPRGTIYDRNGIPLVTTDLAELEQKRQQLSPLAAFDQLRPDPDGRYRPFKGKIFHIIGGLESDREVNQRLRGYVDDRELLPLLRYRFRPTHPDYSNFTARDRSLRLTVDIRLQLRVADLLAERLRGTDKQGAAVILDPQSGELLASVSYPWPTSERASAERDADEDEAQPEFDLARHGLFPPGSTFKLVTAIAALREDPGYAAPDRTFRCGDLGDGYDGARFGRWVVHDVKKESAHGNVTMERGLVVSCNAYFGQLGAGIRAGALFDTASRLRIERLARPNTPERLSAQLGHAAYGQGEVLASPLSMARVAATLASGGVVPPDRLIFDQGVERAREPERLLPRDLATRLADYMHGVVTSPEGTARGRVSEVIAGKTGTAEIADKAHPHAWFIGFAPHQMSGGRRIAFSVIVVKGGWGGSQAAPIADDLVKAARAIGLIR